jgi:hypothetical protein
MSLDLINIIKSVQVVVTTTHNHSVEIDIRELYAALGIPSNADVVVEVPATPASRWQSIELPHLGRLKAPWETQDVDVKDAS